MRIIVTSSSVENEAAGPSYTVPALCSSMSSIGADVELLVLGKLPVNNWRFTAKAFPHSSLALLRRLGWSRGIHKAFDEVAENSDIFHVNGTWMLPQVYPSLSSQGKRAKVVYCPRGGLSKVTFARNRFAKWLMWHVGGQKRAIENAAMFHATSKKEYEEIRACGFTQPVAIIPNGVEVPTTQHNPFEANQRKLVFFGRVHATKAVDHLILAWGNVANEFPNWSLEIAGPDCGALQGLRALVEERGISRVSFVGEFHGRDKYEYLAKADLYVLPSLTENFGITIAEALACGTPVIASKGCPWSLLDSKQCGWWVDVGVDALTSKLKEVLQLPASALKEAGERGRRWMVEDYAWQGIAKKVLAACEWLLHQRTIPRPDFVRID